MDGAHRKDSPQASGNKRDLTLPSPLVPPFPLTEFSHLRTVYFYSVDDRILHPRLFNVKHLEWQKEVGLLAASALKGDSLAYFLIKHRFSLVCSIIRLRHFLHCHKSPFVYAHGKEISHERNSGAPGKGDP